MLIKKPPVTTRALIALGRHTPLGRGKARKMLLKAIDRRHAGPIDTSFEGVPIRLRLDNNTERRALFGHHNQHELAFLQRRLMGGGVFVDVGANSGLFTQFIAGHCPAQILAIEPNPVMCHRIKENLALLDQAGRCLGKIIAIEQCAIGPEIDAGYLDASGGYGTAHLVPTSDRGAIVVTVRSLVDILAAYKLDRVDALKIDIEGDEAKALGPFFSDAPPSLFPRAIVIEHSSSGLWGSDLFSQLFARGYREEARTRSNSLLSLPE
jgi:FkbM family methyltransferase